MKQISTYEEMAEVISKPYIDYKGIMVLVPIGEKAAQKVMRLIQEVMIENGEPVISSRPRLVPTEYVLKEFGLSAANIIKNAKEMKL